MPRKKIGTVTSKIPFAAILEFFATSSIEIADFALDLVTNAVKQRHNKGKAVLAGRSKSASTTEAVDSATRSAIGAPVADGAAPVKERKKPGPPKGTGKGKKKVAAGGAADATAGDAAAPAALAEVTDHAALPPQEGALDLDKA